MTRAESATNLRDYSANHRMLLISGLAAVLGGAGAVLAWALLGLIRLSTNVFYFHRLSFADASPAFSTVPTAGVYVNAPATFAVAFSCVAPSAVP